MKEGKQENDGPLLIHRRPTSTASELRSLFVPPGADVKAPQVETDGLQGPTPPQAVRTIEATRSSSSSDNKKPQTPTSTSQEKLDSPSRRRKSSNRFSFMQAKKGSPDRLQAEEEGDLSPKRRRLSLGTSPRPFQMIFRLGSKRVLNMYGKEDEDTVKDPAWVPKDLMGVGEIDGTLSLDDDKTDSFDGLKKKHSITRFKWGACRCLFWSSSMSDYRILKSIWFHLTALGIGGAFWGLYYIFDDYVHLLGDDPELVLYIFVFVALTASVAYVCVLIQAILIAILLSCLHLPCCVSSPVAEVCLVRGLSTLSYLATLIVLLNTEEQILDANAPEDKLDVITKVLQSTLAFGIIFALTEIGEHALLAYINDNTQAKAKRAEIETKRAILQKLIGDRPISKAIAANIKSKRVTELRKSVITPGVRLNAEQGNLIQWLLQGQGDPGHHGPRNSLAVHSEDTPNPSDPPSPDASPQLLRAPTVIGENLSDLDQLAVPMGRGHTEGEEKAEKEKKERRKKKESVWSRRLHLPTLTKGMHFTKDQVENTSNYKIQFDYMLLNDSRWLIAKLCDEKQQGNAFNPHDYELTVYMKFDRVSLGLADFERVFKPATARFAWKIFMKVPGERLVQAQVFQALKDFYSEMLGIEKATHGLPAVGSTLHFVLRAVAVVIWGIILLRIFEYDIATTLFTLLTLSGLFTLALGGVIQDVTSSLMMALWQQPYMVGDRIIISAVNEKMKYWVNDITLLTTTCRDIYGQVNIFPNSQLAKARIINLSRTMEAQIEIIITIGFYTPEEKLREFVLRVTNYISSKRLLFKPKVSTYVYSFDKSQDLTIGFWFVHRAAASSPEIFNAKSQLQEFMRKQLMDLGIKWRPLPQPYKLLGNDQPETKTFFGPNLPPSLQPHDSHHNTPRD